MGVHKENSFFLILMLFYPKSLKDKNYTCVKPLSEIYKNISGPCSFYHGNFEKNVVRNTRY